MESYHFSTYQVDSDQKYHEGIYETLQFQDQIYFYGDLVYDTNMDCHENEGERLRLYPMNFVNSECKFGYDVQIEREN